MAIGDQLNITARVRALLPSWFGSTTPLLTATLQSYAVTGAFVYSLYAYTKLQTRILTATDGWLDMIAADYFGTGLFRAAGQSDASFRTRIVASLLRERATHQAMVKVLQDITGRTPQVVELRRVLDTGAYGYLFGYGVRGAYGSLWPSVYQAFVIAYRPLAGSGFTASDADIFSAVDGVKPIGTVIWTAISN